MSDNQFDFGPAAKQIESLKGAANGLASLDSNGLVPSSQLPGVTQSVAGLMSAADKTKLDGIATGATANVVSDSLSDTSTTNALSAAKGKALNDSITALNTQIAKQQSANQWSDNTATLSAVQTYAENLAGNDVGIFLVGYSNATASTAIGLPSGAYFIYFIKASSLRACLEFVNIETGKRSHVGKVSTWSSTIINVDG